jgi:hypothetical protein
VLESDVTGGRAGRDDEATDRGILQRIAETNDEAATTELSPGAVWFAGYIPVCYVFAYVYLDSRFRRGRRLVWPMGVAATTGSEVPHCNFDSPHTSTSTSSSSPLHLLDS